MTDIDEKQMPLNELGVVGPGSSLQKARMEKNLRPEDVAYEIRLTPTQVLALEDDDYSKMPEPTYVRGYLRNYARLVGLPESDVMLAYARLTRSEDRQTHHVLPRSEKQIDSGGGGVRIVAGLLLVVLVVVSALWFYFQQAEETPAPQVAEQETAEPVLPTGTSTLKLSEAEPQEASNEQPAVGIAPGTTESGSDTTDAAEAASTGEAQETVSAETLSPVVPALVTEPVAVVTEPPVAEPQTDTADTSPAATTGQGRLIITYSKDSWTDIRDANGEKLLYRTVKAGQTVAIAGDLPLSLFFGFAQGVSVNFNGQDIDLSPYTRGVFARLSLGESAQ